MENAIHLTSVCNDSYYQWAFAAPLPPEGVKKFESTLAKRIQRVNSLKLRYSKII